MGLLPVDSGIKCVASVNFYLLIPLLFYDQSWIMLPSMNTCGSEKKKNQWHVSHTCVARPSPVRSPLFFWSPVEKVHLLGLMMSETPFHGLLQTATTSPGQGHVLMWFFSIYFQNPFPSSRRNQSKMATARPGGDAACVGHELHFRGSLRSILTHLLWASIYTGTRMKTHVG